MDTKALDLIITALETINRTTINIVERIEALDTKVDELAQQVEESVVRIEDAAREPRYDS